MARAFDGTASNYIMLGIDALGPLMHGASVISVAVRYYLNNSPEGSECLIAVVAQDGWSVFAPQFLADDTLALYARSIYSDANKSVVSTGTANTGAWNTCGGVADYANDNLYIYLNGTRESNLNVGWSQASYSHTTSNRDDDIIGAYDNNGSIVSSCDGSLAEMAMWSVDIGQVGFDAIHKFASPLMVRPESLLLCWPLIGRTSTEIELINNKEGTVTGSAAAAHPPVMYPVSPMMVHAPPSAFIPVIGPFPTFFRV